MTITRIGQITAETGSSGEYSKLTSATVTLESTIKRSGNYSWNLGSGAGIGLTFPDQTGIRSNFAAYINAINLGGYLCYLHSNGTYNRALAVHLETGALEIYVNNTIVYTVNPLTAGFAVGAWNDVGLVYQSGVSGFASVYLNGNLLYTHTGNLVANLDYYIALNGVGVLEQFNGTYLDDYYIDAITPDEIDHVPSTKIFLASIANNQATVEFTPVGDTPNYRCIDETGVPDGDTTYVKALDPGLEDLYAVTPISVPADYRINAVIPTAVAKKGDAGLNATLTPVIFDGAEYAVGDDKALGLSYAVAWHRFTTKPDGSAWTESEYEAMEFGFRSSGTY